MANVYHDLDKRKTDRRTGAGGYAGPERRIGERRKTDREPPSFWLLAAVALLALILVDIYFFQSQYRHAFWAEVNETANALRAWSNGLWGAGP